MVFLLALNIQMQETQIVSNSTKTDFYEKQSAIPTPFVRCLGQQSQSYRCKKP